MRQNTFMRIPKNLLEDIKGCKIAHRESYADVVKRLIEKEKIKKMLGGK